jgi:hypothetical protein
MVVHISLAARMVKDRYFDAKEEVNKKGNK